VFLSSISVYEIQLKKALKRLNVEIDYEDLVREEILTELPLTFKHSEHCFDLPLIHRDPFDRMLIAQSIVEKIPLITSDKMIQQYDFKFISA